jgi:hypothetical protein
MISETLLIQLSLLYLVEDSINQCKVYVVGAFFLAADNEAVQFLLATTIQFINDEVKSCGDFFAREQNRKEEDYENEVEKSLKWNIVITDDEIRYSSTQDGDHSELFGEYRGVKALGAPSIALQSGPRN